MKELIIVINDAVPFGRALNAAAHSALGMGHRIPHGKVPNITVLLASTAQIRDFRQAAYEIYIKDPAATLYADFTNTMVGGTTDEQLTRTRNTPESEMVYSAVAICSDDQLLSKVRDFLSLCRLLPNYKQMTTELSAFSFQPLPTYLENHDPIYKQFHNYKAVIAFNKKQDIAESINAMILACLDIGKKAELISLHLLLYIDASEIKHPNISYHAMPIVTAKNQGKLEAIADQVQQNQALTSTIIKDSSNIVNIVGVFGDSEEVNAYTKQCSLWNREVAHELID